jgi:hypothetical protein
MALQVSGQYIKTGSPGIPYPQDQQGALLATEFNPRYYAQAYSGQTFFIGGAAGALTAYVGAAGGTPLIGLWNPAGTGKNLVLLRATVAIATQATTTLNTTTFRLYGGATVAITQATVTTPVSCLSLAASGSIAKAYLDVATTSSTALTYMESIGSYWWSTAVGTGAVPPMSFDFGGCYIVAPGNMVALGSYAALTALTVDASLIWAEQAIYWH